MYVYLLENVIKPRRYLKFHNKLNTCWRYHLYKFSICVDAETEHERLSVKIFLKVTKITKIAYFSERFNFTDLRVDRWERSDVHHIRRQKQSETSDSSSEYLKRERSNTKFQPNLQKIAFCAVLGLFRRYNRRVLDSACKME